MRTAGGYRALSPERRPPCPYALRTPRVFRGLIQPLCSRAPCQTSQARSISKSAAESGRRVRRQGSSGREPGVRRRWRGPAQETLGKPSSAAAGRGVGRGLAPWSQRRLRGPPGGGEYLAVGTAGERLRPLVERGAVISAIVTSSTGYVCHFGREAPTGVFGWAAATEHLKRSLADEYFKADRMDRRSRIPPTRPRPPVERRRSPARVVDPTEGRREHPRRLPLCPARATPPPACSPSLSKGTA